MAQYIAISVFGLFIYWLFARDSKRRKKLSVAIWIPITWAFIVGSKPVSFWLGIHSEFSGPEYVDDTMLDKALYIVLLAAGLWVLNRRRTNWQRVFQRNRWLFLFFIYLLVSVVWADDPVVSFKRWIKDFGNIIMVLVIFSEEEPLEAIRAFLAGCAYLLIPLSVMLVKYYPRLATQYNIWTGEAFCVALSTNKNSLGMTLSSCGVSLCWMWLDAWEARALKKDKITLGAITLLLLMVGWLLTKAKSSTALTCTAMGGAVLLGLRFPALRRRVKQMGVYAGVAIMLVLILQVTGLWETITAAFAEAVGRDPTFHGRKEIWAALLKQDVNPLIGVGYYSFWTDERMRKLSEGYHYLLNEAHNGYLETYLNSGLVGLGLLFTLLVASAKSMKNEVLSGSNYGALRFAFLFASLFYAMSEAIFNRLSLLWLVVIMAMMEFPRRAKKIALEMESEKESEPGKTQMAGKNFT